MKKKKFLQIINASILSAYVLQSTPIWAFQDEIDKLNSNSSIGSLDKESTLPPLSDASEKTEETDKAIDSDNIISNEDVEQEKDNELESAPIEDNEDITINVEEKPSNADDISKEPLPLE